MKKPHLDGPAEEDPIQRKLKLLNDSPEGRWLQSVSAHLGVGHADLNSWGLNLKSVGVLPDPTRLDVKTALMPAPEPSSKLNITCLPAEAFSRLGSPYSDWPASVEAPPIAAVNPGVGSGAAEKQKAGPTLTATTAPPQRPTRGETVVTRRGRKKATQYRQRAAERSAFLGRIQAERGLSLFDIGQMPGPPSYKTVRAWGDGWTHSGTKVIKGQLAKKLTLELSVIPE